MDKATETARVFAVPSVLALVRRSPQSSSLNPPAKGTDPTPVTDVSSMTRRKKTFRETQPPRYELLIGDEAPEGERFCPLTQVKKYPYMSVVPAELRGLLQSDFFKNSCFYGRRWDFQFEHFISTIGSMIQEQLRMPVDMPGTSFYLEFPCDGTSRPKYLGYSNDWSTAEGLKLGNPRSGWIRPGAKIYTSREPTEDSVQAFKSKIRMLLDTEKRSQVAAKKSSKEKKKRERIARQQSWNQLLKRSQRYLGLRKPRQDDTATFAGSHMNIFPASAAPRPNGVCGPLDLEQPAPFQPEGWPVFICVDVEAYERDRNLITEIGIAVLDSNDIKGKSPGAHGVNWRGMIRARHFRIKEYENYHNSDFIAGCAANFEFGKSEWISIADAPREVAHCFLCPTPSVTGKGEIGGMGSIAGRNLILVGHDVGTDVNYLRKVGFDPLSLPNLREVVDTASMYRALTRETNPRKLGSVLETFDIPGWFLHNAGNDAVYTLQAMLGIAIKGLLPRAIPIPGGSLSDSDTERAVPPSDQPNVELHEGWSSDEGDGGPPVEPRFLALPKVS